ncbi:MAG: hypothetical protein ABGZ49_13465 [Akkermansiaceae bacterium]
MDPLNCPIVPALFLLGFSQSAMAQSRVSPKEAVRIGGPTMQGPYGNFRVSQTGATLVDDLSKARLVGESEEKNFGQAKHTTVTVVCDDLRKK